MTASNLKSRLAEQQFPNGYELVDGVGMHAEHGERFQIPPPVVKRYVTEGQFVQLRLDSTRFSAHPGAPGNCECPHCNEEATNPILCHEHPSSLVDLPKQEVASRGWGEEFWARVTSREAGVFSAEVDNRLCETRLHGLDLGDAIYFADSHILAVHSVHRAAMVAEMTERDLKELARWLGTNRK